MTKTFDPTMISPTLIDPNASNPSANVRTSGTPGARYQITTLRDLMKTGMPRPGKPTPPSVAHTRLALRLKNYLPRMKFFDLEDLVVDLWDYRVNEARESWGPPYMPIPPLAHERTFGEIKADYKAALKEDDEEKCEQLVAERVKLLEKAAQAYGEKFVTVDAPIYAPDGSGKIVKRILCQVRVDVFFTEQPLVRPSRPVLCYLKSDGYPAHLRGKEIAPPEPEPTAPVTSEPVATTTAAAATNDEDEMAGLVDPFALLRPKN